MNFEPGEIYEMRGPHEPNAATPVRYIGISLHKHGEAVVECVRHDNLYRIPFDCLHSLKKKRRFWCVQKLGSTRPQAIYGEWENAMRYARQNKVDYDEQFQIFEVESVEAV